jgi:hypothetical protein
LSAGQKVVTQSIQAIALSAMLKIAPSDFRKPLIGPHPPLEGNKPIAVQV